MWEAWVKYGPSEQAKQVHTTAQWEIKQRRKKLERSGTLRKYVFQVYTHTNTLFCSAFFRFSVALAIQKGSWIHIVQFTSTDLIRKIYKLVCVCAFISQMWSICANNNQHLTIIKWVYTDKVEWKKGMKIVLIHFIYRSVSLTLSGKRNVRFSGF